MLEDIEMRNPLVSLIVPVYNVEPYIKECLESILGQTYRNLEIILINDGSTDDSFSICKKYAESDERIRLISKENGGLASARNRGIREAKGDYIGFIDSDDRIHNKFVEALIKEILIYDCGIAVSDYSNNIKKINYSENKSILLERSDAISRLLDDRGYKCFACNKLFKKSLFSDINFPEGELFEDIIPLYKLFKKVQNIAYVKCPLYYYRTRKGSISRAKFTKGNYHLIKSIDYLIKDALKCPDNDRERLMLGYISYFMGFVRRGMLAEADIDKEIVRLRLLVKKYKRIVLKRRSNITDLKKIELILFTYFPFLYSLILRVVRKRK